MISVITSGPLIWSIGDKPTVKAELQDEDGNILGIKELAFGTFRSIDNIGGPIEPEGLLELLTTKVRFNFAERFPTFTNGIAYFRAALIEPGVFSLNGNITAAVNIPADINVSTGAEIPNTGFIIVEGEVFRFEKLTDTSIQIVRRALFNTVAAAHTDVTGIKISAELETAIPEQPFEVNTDNPIDSDRADLFSSSSI